MPPFRVAVKHTDKKHPNSVLFQVGAGFDERERADEILKGAKERFPEKDGYKHKLQELVDADRKLEGVGNEVVTSVRWKDVG